VERSESTAAQPPGFRSGTRNEFRRRLVWPRGLWSKFFQNSAIPLRGSGGAERVCCGAAASIPVAELGTSFDGDWWSLAGCGRIFKSRAIRAGWAHSISRRVRMSEVVRYRARRLTYICAFENLQPWRHWSNGINPTQITRRSRHCVVQEKPGVPFGRFFLCGVFRWRGFRSLLPLRR
jgi:hypothetical protein